jgi:lipopolysaccharide export system permease protein
MYILIDMTSTLDEIIDRQIPIPVLIKYYLSFFPIILVQTSSFACLIATLLTFSKLNNNNEIIVMRSSGLSFWQIAKPALFISLVISAMIFLINEKLVPQAMIMKENIRNENMILKVDRERKKMANIENLTFYGVNNRLYFIDSFNPRTYELKGITIIGYNPDQTIKEKIVAFEGIWTGLAWKFFQCQITAFDKAVTNRPMKVKVYTEKLMDIKETPEDFLRQRLNFQSMNMRQLNDYIERFSNSGAVRALNNLKVDLYQKLSYPFGNFVIVFLGIPFALIIRSRKGMTFTSLGVAIAIGFLYYVANAVFLAFGKGGAFPPLLAAWSAPILFIMAALVIVKTNF